MDATASAGAIFISYSSKHRDLTRTLAAAIDAQYGEGSAWWDHALESWGDFEIQIRNALHQARAVVVIWSKAAGESDWVKSEAGRANSAAKLVNVLPPDTAWRDVPSPYGQHDLDLADTHGILRSIDAVWTGRVVRTAVPLDEIYFRQHGQRLLDPKQTDLPGDLREVSPSELLQAQYGVVGYADVTGQRERLLGWCREAVEPATSGRIVHGGGGLGKTRLVTEVAAKLRDAGWTAGFRERPRESSESVRKQWRQALEQRVSHADDRGLFIAIDYAEARQGDVRVLAGMLRARPRDEARPIRVVLLGRSAGEWWTTLVNETPDVAWLFRAISSEPHDRRAYARTPPASLLVEPGGVLEGHRCARLRSQVRGTGS